MSADHPTAPPLPPSAPTTPSLPRRLACWTYEGLLLFGVIYLAGYLFSVTTQTRHALDNRAWQQVFLFFVLGLYFVWFWTKGVGQTLAMKTWHIRVVDAHGQALTRARAALRYLCCWAWFAPPFVAGALLKLQAVEIGVLLMGWVLIWAILARFHPRQQFWHDALAGTQLVHHKPT